MKLSIKDLKKLKRIQKKMETLKCIMYKVKINNISLLISFIILYKLGRIFFLLNSSIT